MRVLFFSTVFPHPGAPTAGPYNRALCEALAEDHEVVVVVARRWWSRARPAPEPGPGPGPGVPSLSVHVTTWWYPPGLMRRWHHRWMAATAGRRLRREIARLRPDMVLSYWIHPDATVAVAATASKETLSVVMVGGSDVLGLQPGSVRERQSVATLHAVDAVVVVGRALGESVRALGIPADRVHVVAQGIDPTVFHPADGERAGSTVIWVGRMVPVKRLDVVTEAFALLHARRPDARLVMVGGGPERARIERLVVQLGVADAVHWVGELSPEQVAEELRRADVLVLGSDSEGTPNVLREALACGVPFVSTDVGSVRDLACDGWTSFVPPGDPAELADALEQVLSVDRPSGPPPMRPWAVVADELVALADQVRARSR